jgi:hypothetical protein
MRDVYVGQQVAVLPYSKLKAACDARSEVDQARKNTDAEGEGGTSRAGKHEEQEEKQEEGERGKKGKREKGRARGDVEQQQRGGGSEYAPMKRAARWLGDKGSRADLFGEVLKLDYADGTVQVKLRRMLPRVAGGAAEAGRPAASEFNDWFVPAALRSLPRQNLTKAESVAREKAKALLVASQGGGADHHHQQQQGGGGGDTTAAIADSAAGSSSKKRLLVTAKATEESDLKGRARSKTARRALPRMAAPAEAAAATATARPSPCSWRLSALG